MLYAHDTYVVPGGRDLTLSQEIMHGGVILPRQLAIICFRLIPHDEISLGGGFVVPSTADTQRIADEQAEEMTPSVLPIESVQQATPEAFIKSIVATGQEIAEEGYPYIMPKLNPSASEPEMLLLQQIGQSLQHGEYVGTAPTVVDDAGLHLGNYL